MLAAGPTRSFEFFPPKSDDEAAQLDATLDELAPLAPSFVSVTYRGGPTSRERTFDLVTRIQRAGSLTAMAHLICVGHTRAEMRDVLERYRGAGVQNVMALGGDVPLGEESSSEFAHAIDLVELVRDVGDFAIGVAAHPLGHPRSPSRSSDRFYLAEKLDRADFAVTQFFFRADEWSELVDELASLGVERPVLPGIMPVTSLASVDRMATMGAAVPDELVARLRDADDRGGARAVRAEGIAAATVLATELVARGAPGLHFYTLNRSTATREIHRTLFESGDAGGERRVG